jgi:hypothetical protein
LRNTFVSENLFADRIRRAVTAPAWMARPKRLRRLAKKTSPRPNYEFRIPIPHSEFRIPSPRRRAQRARIIKKAPERSRPPKRPRDRPLRAPEKNHGHNRTNYRIPHSAIPIPRSAFRVPHSKLPSLVRQSRGTATEKGFSHQRVPSCEKGISHQRYGTRRAMPTIQPARQCHPFGQITALPVRQWATASRASLTSSRP